MWREQLVVEQFEFVRRECREQRREFVGVDVGER
jgi:hypothetical protein